jgi:hypothetical protein
MSILPIVIHMFDAIPIKIPMTFITEIEKPVLKFICKHNRPRITKPILSKKAMLEVSQYPTSNYYRAIAIKTAWYWHKKQI